MTWPGASSGEMPTSPLPGQAGPELDKQLLDAILTGQQLPLHASGQARVVAEMLASLAGPAGPGDLAGEEAARLAFARAASPAGLSASRRAGRRRPTWLPARLSARLAAALAAAAVGLGGTVAAYAGVLPAPIQDLAHYTIGAPPARHAATFSPHRAGHRLCAAYTRAETDHDAETLAAAFRKLARAAGGAHEISAYCAAAGLPGLTPSAHPDGHLKLHPAKGKAAKGKGKGKAKAKGKAKGHAQSHATGGSPGNGKGRAQGNSQGNGKGHSKV
jgi:hypothetical protein